MEISRDPARNHANATTFSVSVNVVECHNDIEVPIGNTLSMSFDAKNDFLDWVRILEEEEDDKFPGTDFQVLANQNILSQIGRAQMLRHSRKTVKNSTKKGSSHSQERRGSV